MDITLIKDRIKFSKDGPHKEVISDIAKAKTVLICLEIGQSAEDTTKSEVSLFVLEGKGSFIINGKEEKVEKGGLLVLNGNEAYNMKADSRMVILAIITK
ncbi:MAG: hypothetical protein HZC45_08125 [Deltaproteobacteria bacterium]|nr:hypothetical protein [Deltaproteobacteria bacterium]